MRPSLTSHGSSLTVATSKAAVSIDATRNMLVVDSPTYDVIVLGASRAGVAAATGVALDEIDADGGERELSTAIIECLRRAALSAEFGCPEDRYSDRGLWWSPLAYSRPFLTARWLIQDVQRFFPCRVALAHIEDLTDDSTVEAAASAVARLHDPSGSGKNWRALFSPTGEVGRPLNATLADFGEDASAYALWGLRRVPVNRRAQSLVHLEVLGALGRHPDASLLIEHMRIVENASVDELKEQIERIPRQLLALPENVSAEHALPEVIAWVADVPGASKLKRLVDLALERITTEGLHFARATARPPIPLPDVTGISLLDTVGAIIHEGQRMRHCVATRCAAAVEGRAFIFHVVIDDEPATVQVDARGRVVEARGPLNCDSRAAREGASMLARWGESFPGGVREGEPPSTLPPVRLIERVQRTVEAFEARAGTWELDPEEAVERAKEAARMFAGGAVSVLEDLLSSRKK